MYVMGRGNVYKYIDGCICKGIYQRAILVFYSCSSPNQNQPLDAGCVISASTNLAFFTCYQ